MKRIQLFEFEDFAWFPDWLRQCMTLYIVCMHRLLGTHAALAPLLVRALQRAATLRIVDLGSGGGGPMPAVADLVRREPGMADLQVTLTDLYPNQMAAQAINQAGTPWVRYEQASVDATAVPPELAGVRTMICSFHHMPPALARGILEDAWTKRQPICIYEISDNGPPIWLWWLAIPVAFLTTLVLTPTVRPLTWRQLFFTYVIPILPVLIAWDGAVSNARTYTVADLRELTASLQAPDYEWEMATLRSRGQPGGKVYLLGLPRPA